MQPVPTSAVWTCPLPCVSSMASSTAHAPAAAMSAPLHGEMAGAFRLRLGDYRVLFTLEEDALRIFGVRHRSAAY
jgi:mRNA-degrading endonuclease RelE of RelBE toxin-antitoxin system